MTRLKEATVGVVGAGIMGAGIAQIAAQAGHPVLLLDAREGAAAATKAKLAASFDTLVTKGRLTAESAQQALQRITPVSGLDSLAPCAVVVEAIVEQLAAKRSLMQALEALLPAQAILCTNTSSISVTAIAQGLQHPQRLVGMHFFNPVPLMKLVEVVSGLQTEVAVAADIFELAQSWGKVAVHARSTPGFIVNRIARPFYAEALALLQEQAATPPVIDACLKAVGFRMGPCELMDLIGHDTNFAVTQSVYEANFFDKRYAPSLVQREMVDGGLLGRKSGRGFYRYPEGVPPLPVAVHQAPDSAREISVHGVGPVADWLEARLVEALAPQGWGPERVFDASWTGIAVDGGRLVMTDGRTAAELSTVLGTDNVAVFDRCVPVPTQPSTPGPALAFACAVTADEAWHGQAPAWLAALGFAPLRVADTPGLVVARTLGMLVNEAADAVRQGVCTPDAADAAMKLGVNYPAGPFEWLADWSAAGVAQLLQTLDEHYRGERYRLSPWLREAAAKEASQRRRAGLRGAAGSANTDWSPLGRA
jgi:3-hydroxybutyryl-CoA dehydrogenase